ncbi:MAG: tRNA guanosine(34) transglycosylase Tgt [Elusimicrobia bacterium]|nr:tRNA guanosine(34) transglycosylase Tgt [Elusimicrobiota bacterium]
MTFTIESRDGKTRAGTLKTLHGPVQTPVFMPVATQGTIKALGADDIKALGMRAILANSYHLGLRPGPDVIEAHGGLAKFMAYDGAILTDSGGFQIFSLADLREVDDKGVVFKSHLDGSPQFLTPESVIALQARLGSDMWTTLDECPPYPCTEEQARKALERTMRWTDRSVEAFKREDARTGGGHLFFPILQGSVYGPLRRRAAEHIVSAGPHGVAIGGFSVGEEKAQTWAALAEALDALPEGLPRYLMGMGTPEDLWDAVALGVDMMDCVWPTRVARNGLIMSSRGRLNIKNGAFRNDQEPLDPGCACYTCRTFTRAYLCHLYRAGELAAYRLLTIHNVHFNLATMARIREAVVAGRFEADRKAFLDKYRGGIC